MNDVMKQMTAEWCVSLTVMQRVCQSTIFTSMLLKVSMECLTGIEREAFKTSYQVILQSHRKKIFHPLKLIFGWCYIWCCNRNKPHDTWLVWWHALFWDTTFVLKAFPEGEWWIIVFPMETKLLRYQSSCEPQPAINTQYEAAIISFVCGLIVR